MSTPIKDGILPGWAHYADRAAVEVARARLATSDEFRMDMLRLAIKDIEQALSMIGKKHEPERRAGS